MWVHGTFFGTQIGKVRRLDPNIVVQADWRGSGFVAAQCYVGIDGQQAAARHFVAPFVDTSNY